MARDFLDELRDERVAENPDYERLVAEARQRRAAARVLNRTHIRHGAQQSSALTHADAQAATPTHHLRTQPQHC